MKNRTITFSSLFLVMALLGTGCAKLPVYNSKPKVENAEPRRHGFFDSDTKLIYAVEHNAQNIYLHAYTSEQATQMKMLNAGFTVWFDPTGKKNQTLGIEYPQKRDGQPIEQPQISRSESPSVDRTSRQKEMTKRMFDGFEKMNADNALVTGIGVEGKMPLHLSQLTNMGIDVHLELDTLNTLHYYLTIPRKLLFTEENPDAGELSIGITSEALIMPSRPAGNKPSGGGMRGGGGRGAMVGGGMSGGGMSGGGMGGGPRGGGGGRPPSATNGSDDSMAKAISIWLLANLNRETQKQ